ncbi:hypothetical protein NE237_024993 [Protea cynaroides]|uniref:Uncharacterized protein n=1 Tax=Protea cynaroides TaxID=273540 RepID=A0A9Q0H5A3_9MAGN|nr:hypothetical protein NE237_024993 [Protea cynaroides]
MEAHSLLNLGSFGHPENACKLKSSIVENMNSSEVKLSVDEDGPSAVVEDEVLEIGRMPGDPSAASQERPESRNQLDQGWIPSRVKKKRSVGFCIGLILTRILTNLCKTHVNLTRSYHLEPGLPIMVESNGPRAVLLLEMSRLPPCHYCPPYPPGLTNLPSSAGHSPFASRRSLLSKSKGNKGSHVLSTSTLFDVQSTLALVDKLMSCRPISENDDREQSPILVEVTSELNGDHVKNEKNVVDGITNEDECLMVNGDEGDDRADFGDLRKETSLGSTWEENMNMENSPRC